MLAGHKYYVINTFIIMICLLLISNASLFKDFNNNIYDNFLQFNKTEKKQKEIVIIEIDSESIEKLGIWPLNRSIYNELLDTIFKEGAKVAGFYIDFTVPSRPKIDNEFIETLKKYPTVILDPFIFSSGQPESEFWQKIKVSVSFGHNIIRIEKDGIVRNCSPLLNKVPSFALSVLNLYDKEAFSYKKTVILNNIIYPKTDTIKISINYKTPWYNFKRLSLADVLKGNYHKGIFKDKIVLIGLTKETLTNFYTTPFSKKYAFSGCLAPIFIQAQIIDSLLHYKPIFKVENYLLLLVMILYIPLILIFFRHSTLLRQLLIIVLLFTLVEISIIYLIFTSYFIWIPPALLIIANTLIFIMMTVTSNIKISKFLDSYIYDLSDTIDEPRVIKTDVSVDDKLLTLKEVTTIIENDRFIFDTVLNSVKSNIVLFDHDGNIIYSNTPENYHNIDLLTHQINFTVLKAEVDKNDVYKEIIEFKNKHFEFIASKAKNHLYTGVFNDITEMTHIAETKTTITRMLTHELKTPMTTILLCCDSLFSLNKENSLNKYISKIADQTDFIKDIISNFLELNKLEIPEFTLEESNINIQNLLSTIIEDFMMIAESKNISIKYITETDNPIIFSGDIKYFNIAFKNLIDNAIKYSPNNTTVSIDCKILDSTIVISITDEGFGIDPLYINHLFNKFYRIKNDNTNAIKGTGLGLSFVKKIIELHNGNIEVQSEINKGSTFRIQLPYKKKL